MEQNINPEILQEAVRLLSHLNVSVDEKSRMVIVDDGKQGFALAYTKYIPIASRE
jgi:hypothetical protein